MERPASTYADIEPLDFGRVRSQPVDGASRRDEPLTGATRGGRAAAVDPLIGRVLDGSYHVGPLLARSRMSRIYRGFEAASGTPCVLKFARNPHDHTARLWLRREAYFTQQITHAHVVRLLHRGELAGFGPYLVLEYLDGLSLASLISDGPLPITKAIYIAAQIASALHAVHQLGIEHRDVKPANIVLTGGGNQLPAARLIDFGVAGFISDAGSQASVPSYGTPEYVAPERIEGGPTGPLSDQYSLGCVLYEMLTGRAPFSGGSALAVLSSHLQGSPTPPRELRPDQEISLALEYAVMRAIAREPSARFESMAVLCTALVACLGSSALNRYLTRRAG